MRTIDKLLILAALIIFGGSTVELICFFSTGSMIEVHIAKAFASSEASEAPHFDTPHQARLAATAHIQLYSTFIGFEGRFYLEDSDTTLVMEGSPLCSDDFETLIPPDAWTPVVDTGIKYFECSYKDTYVKKEIR